MRSTAIVRASLLAAAAGVGPAHAAKLMSKIADLPAHVQILEAPAGDQVLTLQVALKLQNVDQLESRLRAVSTPGSPDYGKYLEAAEVNALFSPSASSRAAVLSWLSAAGVTDVADFGSHINFATSVSTADELLGASFRNFAVDGVQKLRTLEYSIPDELAAHVDLVTPTTFLGRMKAQAAVPRPRHRSEQLDRRQSNATPLNCSRLIEPGCLEEMYNYGSYRESATSGSRVGFGSFLEEAALQKDLNAYQKAYGLPVDNFTVVLINGGKDNQQDSGSHGEANLDSQFMDAVAKTLPVTEFITGGRPPFVPNPDVPDAAHNTNEPYLEYYQYLMNQTNAQIPQVISNSYGEDEQTVPQEYAVRVCNYIGMMGLRGITILESSGDTGVGAPCQSNDGKKKPEFTPQFPAGCPYVTAVGGTSAYAPEVAWSASSGGFSNYFPQAWYQTTAVSTYLASHIAPATKTAFARYANYSGRAFPDISAHSLNPSYLYYASGSASYTGGTSAAAPVVAGIIALLNDARLRAGKPTMGFVNPWLYGDGVAQATLTDITRGSALGCNGVNLQTGQNVAGSIIPFASWNGTVGWDPATGLGVPDFMKLMNAALALV